MVSTPARNVVFVCLHGAAKSVLAAAYLRQLAARHGAPVDAIAVGTDPDPEVAPRVVQALLEEGIDVRDHRPRRVSRHDLAGAWRAVSFGCDLEDVAPPGLPVERWDDVPAVSADFDGARDVIAARVRRLFNDSQGCLP